jgi:glyoxylase-like metal-dependent hydrolase (beta-lactamase superfamily II)
MALVAGCSAAPTPEMRVVDEAATALGGMSKIRAVKTLSVEGAGEVFALGQNRTLESELLKWQVGEYRRSIDFPNRRWREESVHTPTFLTGWPDPFRVIVGYGQDMAFDVEEGKAHRLDALAARDRRAELYHHPIGFLRAAGVKNARLENARQAGGQHAVDLVTMDGERFTLIVDSKSRLPARIVSMGHEAALGDVTVTTEFGEFADADGLKVPGHITRKIDDDIVADIRIARTVLNPRVGELEAPEDARTAAPPTTRMTVEDVAPGIWFLAGEGHHSVLVEFADHLMLVEAPVDDRRTLAVIAKAREIRPGKPLTQVVNTHHHFDHSGGIRAAFSEGLTVITHEANRQFFEQVAARPSAVVRDALAKNPKPISIETVADKKVLTDGKRSVELYPITGNGHCASMLMVYFPAERLLAEADAYQPPPPDGPAPVAHLFAANLLDNIEKRGLRVERLLPIHGRIVPFADLVAAARAGRAQG